MHLIVFLTPDALLKRGVILMADESSALEVAHRLLLLPEVQDLAIWAPQDIDGSPNGECWSEEDWRALQEQSGAREYGHIMLARAYGAQ